MCGFVTIINSSTQLAPENININRFLSRISHRGPDGLRTWTSSNSQVQMGHARLSVIDLESGWQPMIDSASGCVISYNGEIYNYKELRLLLESEGVQFRTHSDTEVILRGYIEWGNGVFNRLNGMFAFSLYDTRANTTFLARDPLGIKPLYFTEIKGALFVASELRAIALEAPLNLELDLPGFIEYLSIGYTLAPKTLIHGIQQLEPGHWAEWRKGKLFLNRYTDLANSVNARKGQNLKKSDATQELDSLLKNAVQRQLVADVPVGTFLSGGIDSSLVTSIAHSFPVKPVSAFSMDFHLSTYSEFNQAQKTANSIGIPIQRFELNQNRLAEAWRDYAWKSDAPIFDNSFIPTYELCKASRKIVPVVLSGDGGDELFLGYETYKADTLKKKLDYIGNTPTQLLSLISNLLPTKFGKVTLPYKLKAFSKVANRSIAHAHCGWREIANSDILNLISQPHLKTQLEDCHPKHRFESALHRVPEGDLLTKMSFIDLETWLSNNILVKLDRASMASGLEARVPLLDLDLVKFALGLPDQLKFNIFNPKQLLKEALKQRIPSYPSHQPKSGFNAPMSEWLCGPLSTAMMRLTESDMSLSNVLNPIEIKKLITHHLLHKADYGHLLWALMVVESWLERLHKEKTTEPSFKISDFVANAEYSGI